MIKMRHVFLFKSIFPVTCSLKPILSNKGVTIPSTNIIYRMIEDVSQITKRF